MSAESSSSVNAPDDAPLLCPNCDYNLSGLPENRCPECGEAFDPSDERRFQPATPWERNRSFRSFWSTWWLSLASPRRFVARFHVEQDVRSAALYSWICYGIAVGLFWATGFVITFCLKNVPAEQGLLLFSTTLGVLPAMWLCEAMLASVLGDRIRSRMGAPSNPLWRRLLYYTSGFALFTAIWGGAVMAYIVSSRTTTPVFERLAVPLGVGVFLHWTMALSAMIFQRESPGLMRWLSWALVPLIGAVSIFIGFAFTCIALAVVFTIHDFD